MKYIIALFVLASLCCCSQHGAGLSSYHELDKAIENDSNFVAEKERSIRELKAAAAFTSDSRGKLRLYDKIFSKYYAYKYDSAMAYANRGISLAQRSGNGYYAVKNTLYRSLLLASVGFYEESEQCFGSIDSTRVPESLLYDYYFTKYKMCSFWESYYDGSEFEGSLKPAILENLRKAKAYAAAGSVDSLLLEAELSEYGNDLPKAVRIYQGILHKADGANTVYGQAAYNLARCCLRLKDTARYERFLVEAAVNDIKCATKENAALQDLAVFVYRRTGRFEQAEKYIWFSAEDARFYNSRLRMVGIGKKLPVIMSSYKNEIRAVNSQLTLVAMLISVLSLLLVAVVAFYIRQNRLLKQSRVKITEANAALQRLNDEIKAKNIRLVGINDRREGLAKVYVDLCAKYIERFGRFRTLVERKIKANQTKELLSKISSAELSAGEARVFLRNFDVAFIDMYPDFVEKLNSLFKDGSKAKIREPNSLTTELRVAALIRLGVKDSSEIAQLLFCSPQTIYNYRWGMKLKAIVKETFEDDIMNLCK